MTTKLLRCKVDITRRAASEVCNILNRPETHGTSLIIRREDESRACNAKSLLGLLSLVLRKDDTVELTYEAAYERQLLKALADYFDVV
ncbi:MAG: HPr family phosphocarrier protein [Pseudobutyrivibrio sp.]|nr:HPr family phosphocarrier protein [Pseudobutyrivibrio sp.]